MALTNLNSQDNAWTLQSVNAAQDGRFIIGAFIPRLSATGLTSWRDGVIAATGFGGSNGVPNDMQIKAVTPTPSLSLTCEAGHCVITRSGNAVYLCYLPTQGTLTLAAADPTNPRIDRIVAQVYDSALSDTLPTTPTLSSPGGLVIRPVTGTPAGSPSAPATPTGAISLATVAVAANATQITTANITDTRKSTMNPGGARALLPGDLITDAAGVVGDLRYSTDTNRGGLGVWVDGNGWQRVTPRVIAQPTQTGWGVVNAGSTMVIASMAIPDIGGSYYLRASGAVEWFLPSAADGAMGLQIRVDSNVWDDNTVLSRGLTTASDTLPGVFALQTYAPPRSTAIMSGSHTLYLIAKNHGGSTEQISPNALYSFECTMYPAF